MSGAWTPGPWRVDCSPRIYDRIIASEDGQPDCTIAETGAWGRQFKDEQHANARLIAAAPELYEALEAIVRSGAGLTREQRIHADAALAKAKGNQ